MISSATKSNPSVIGADLGDVCVIGLGAIDTIIEYGRAVSDAEFLEREQAVKGPI